MDAHNLIAFKVFLEYVKLSWSNKYVDWSYPSIFQQLCIYLTLWYFYWVYPIGYDCHIPKIASSCVQTGQSITTSWSHFPYRHPYLSLDWFQYFVCFSSHGSPGWGVRCGGCVPRPACWMLARQMLMPHRVPGPQRHVQYVQDTDHTFQVTLDISGSPIAFNGAPGNIQSNLTGITGSHYQCQWSKSEGYIGKLVYA